MDAICDCQIVKSDDSGAAGYHEGSDDGRDGGHYRIDNGVPLVVIFHVRSPFQFNFVSLPLPPCGGGVGGETFTHPVSGR